MSRYDSSSHEALSQGSIVAHRYLVNLGVTSSTFYACTGYKYLYAMGNTYTPFGTGEIAGIDTIQEESDPFPRDVVLWVSAINSEQLYEPMREDMFNRPVEIYDSWLDPTLLTVVHTPQHIWSGKVNELELFFNDKDKGSYYQVTIQTELRRVPVVAYFNQQTLWQQFSGDTFYSLQHLIATQKAQWGQKDTYYSAPTIISPGPGGDQRFIPHPQ